MIEPMPNKETLAYCQQAWNLGDLVFIRKMENIVFSSTRDKQKVFLRLTTPFRRSKPQIESELQFISHLAQAGLRVPEIILNNQGLTITTLEGEQQLYQAVLFKCVEGEHPSIDHVVMPSYLKSLGSLIATMHNVSQKYEHLFVREHWYEERGLRHARTGAKLSNAPIHSKLNEAINWIQSLAITPQTYGLVHADLGASNLFVKANGSIGIIDFDDACYHFYAFDLAIVLYSMAMRFGHIVPNQLEKEWMKYLLEGYQNLRSITKGQTEQILRFMEFACLRLYFWIEDHLRLNTFHPDALTRIYNMKQWAFERSFASDHFGDSR